MKPLLPTLRQKKRYLVFEVISKKRVAFKKIKESITQSMLRLFGEIQTASAGLMFVGFKNQKGIIKVANNYVDELKTALLFTGQNEIYRSVSVSGMINKAEVKLDETNAPSVNGL